nr:MAG TPA: Hepatocyte nuclear factor 4-alpha, Nuclear Factor, Transcription-DNA complex [Caudoviricetes sp.]
MFICFFYTIVNSFARYLCLCRFDKCIKNMFEITL